MCLLQHRLPLAGCVLAKLGCQCSGALQLAVHHSTGVYCLLYVLPSSHQLVRREA